MPSYPPTSEEILEDDRPVHPPTYEDSIKPAPRRASAAGSFQLHKQVCIFVCYMLFDYSLILSNTKGATYSNIYRPEMSTGKPERPAPPYCAVEQISRPVPTPSYPAPVQYPAQYPSTSQYPPAPGGQYPLQVNQYPVTGQPPYAARTDQYDGQRTISMVGPVPPHQHPQQPNIVTGQCHKLEIWLASKTGMRSCLVTMIMCAVLTIVSWVIGVGQISVFLIIAGMVALGLLIWSFSLRKQIAKRVVQNERNINFDRVEIRRVPA